jgi:integrase
MQLDLSVPAIKLNPATGAPNQRRKFMIGSTRYQQGCLILAKNKKTDDTWFLRFYEDRAGKRVYRKHRLGTVKQLPHRRDAEKAAHSLRAKINTEVRCPETVDDLTTHYSKYELTECRKAFATVDAHSSYIKLHILPKWGTLKLTEVRTVAVEKWLDSLPYAPATKTKIRNILSAIFSHGIRHEWITFNPISKVRCSAKRLREPDVLMPSEFQALMQELSLREQAMVMLAGTTGLRRSELFALRWNDVNFQTMEVAVTRSCVRGRFGNVKTVASGKPVPLHQDVVIKLVLWRQESAYKGEGDFLFPSDRLNGKKPLTPDMVLRKVIRPALNRAGVKNKVIGWHSFRHSLATNLRSLGVDVKVAQELLRHANSRITMDLYTRAVSADKRSASGRQVEMLLGRGGEVIPESSLVIPQDDLGQLSGVTNH